MKVKVLKDFHDVFVGDPDCFVFKHLPCSLKELLGISDPDAFFQEHDQ